jgi:hypothetical protein
MNGNFKARCIGSGFGADALYTKGKIYSIENGVLTWDDGDKTNRSNPILDISDLNSRMNAIFELVEEPKESEIDTEKFLINYFLQKATDKELLIEIERRLNK